MNYDEKISHLEKEMTIVSKKMVNLQNECEDEFEVLVKKNQSC